MLAIFSGLKVLNKYVKHVHDHNNYEYSNQICQIIGRKSQKCFTCLFYFCWVY